MKYMNVLILTIVFFVVGCKEDSPVVPVPPPVDVITPTPTPVPTPTPTPAPSPLYTGPESVNKYVVKFVEDAKAQGNDVLPGMKAPMLSIRIASLDHLGSSVIGLCERSSSLRRVTLDPDFWNRVSETQKELLMHHELGHCVLRRPHRSDKLATGAYASIMYPLIMNSSSYTNNYAYYQEELFTWEALLSEDVPTTHVCDFENDEE